MAAALSRVLKLKALTPANSTDAAAATAAAIDVAAVIVDEIAKVALTRLLFVGIVIAFLPSIWTLLFLRCCCARMMARLVLES